jgi:hypothetical protein
MDKSEIEGNGESGMGTGTNLQRPEHKLTTLLIRIRRIHTNALLLPKFLENLVCNCLRYLFSIH